MESFDQRLVCSVCKAVHDDELAAQACSEQKIWTRSGHPVHEVGTRVFFCPLRDLGETGPVRRIIGTVLGYILKGKTHELLSYRFGYSNDPEHPDRETASCNAVEYLVRDCAQVTT